MLARRWLVAVMALSAGAGQADAQSLRPRLWPVIARFEVAPADAERALTDLPFTDAARTAMGTTGQIQNAADQDLIASWFSTAARFARDHGPDLIAAMRARSRDPELVGAASRSGYVAGRHAAVAMVALNDDWLEKVAAKLDAAHAAAIREDAAAIRRYLRAAAEGLPVGSLYADGAVRNAVGGDSTSQGAATGSLGLSVAWPNGWSMALTVAVASATDTIVSNYGSIVMIPGAGQGNLSNYLFEVRSPVISVSKARSRGILGVLQRFPWAGAYFYHTGSNSLWRAAFADTTLGPPVTVATDTAVRSAAIIGAGFGLYRDVLNRRLLNTAVQFSGQIGIAIRHIRGNMGGDKERLQQLFGGNEKRNFRGIEFGVQMTIGAVTAGVQYYKISRQDRPAIPGLHSGQLIIGLGIQGTIVSGPLDPL